MFGENLDQDNLHHAYLIEGSSDEVVPEILKFLKSLNVDTIGNPDFINIKLDSFKMEDARSLKSYLSEKSFSNKKNAKKIFLISANSFLLEAQNSLLKIFEEPIHNTHFFIIMPDVNSLLKTFVSRFYFISTKSDLAIENKEALKFLAISLNERIFFIKELLMEVEEEDEKPHSDPLLQGEGATDSARSKALKFLNSLESALHKKVSKRHFDTGLFEHIFKVREFLRMPGSSTKMLMESVALATPIL